MYETNWLYLIGNNDENLRRKGIVLGILGMFGREGLPPRTEEEEVCYCAAE